MIKHLANLHPRGSILLEKGVSAGSGGQYAAVSISTHHHALERYAVLQDFR